MPIERKVTVDVEIKAGSKIDQKLFKSQPYGPPSPAEHDAIGSQSEAIAKGMSAALSQFARDNAAKPRVFDPGKMAEQDRVNQKSVVDLRQREINAMPFGFSRGALRDYRGAVGSAIQERDSSTIGSAGHAIAVQKEIAARKDLIKAEKADRFVGNTAQYGRFIATLKEIDERVSTIGHHSGTAFALAHGAILGFTAAASPEAFDTFTGSMRLFAGEVGMSFIPHVARASGWVQSMARFVREMNPDLRSAAAGTMFWGGALAAGVYGLTRLWNVGSSVVQMLGSMNTAVHNAAGGIGGPRGLGYAAGSATRGAMDWLRNNRAIASGALGAAAMLGGSMMGGFEGGYLSNMGLGAITASSLVPAGASMGTFGAVGLGVGTLMSAANFFGSSSSPVAPALPPGSLSAQGESVRDEVAQALQQQQDSTLNVAWLPGRRLDAIQRVLDRYGLRAAQLGITEESLRGEGVTASFTQQQNQAVGTQVAAAVNNLPETAASAEQRAAALEARANALPAGAERARLLREAAQIRLTSATSQQNQILHSTGFQSQQTGVESLHAQIQGESMRDNLQQAQFEQQMRSLELLTNSINELNANLNALN